MGRAQEAPSNRWDVPPSLHAATLRMHYQGYSARAIYLTFWPGGDNAPCRVSTFTLALQRLVASTEEAHLRSALAHGVPLVDAGSRPTDDDWARIASEPRVVLDPLDPASQEALMDLDGARQVICDALREAAEAPLDLEAGETRAKRGQSVAALANALGANVATRLKARQLQVQATVIQHNLRLAREEEADRLGARRALPAGEADSRRLPTQEPDAPAFQLDLGEGRPT